MVCSRSVHVAASVDLRQLLLLFTCFFALIVTLGALLSSALDRHAGNVRLRSYKTKEVRGKQRCNLLFINFLL